MGKTGRFYVDEDERELFGGHADGSGEMDDDEDEEDEQDEYEKDGFVVDDAEEDGGEGGDYDEERQKKKKRKKKEEYLLDEDDYELLEDNNIKIPRQKGGKRFKRLKKARKGLKEESYEYFKEKFVGSSIGFRTAEEKKDPPPTDFDKDKFRSEESYQRYLDIYQTKPLILSRVYEKKCISGLDFSEISDALGLSTLFSIQRRYSEEAVRLFYANMHIPPGPTHSIKTYVYGKSIKVNCALLNTILKCPVDEHTDQYYMQGKEPPLLQSSDYREFLRLIARDPANVPYKPKANDLNITARLVHHLVTYNLLPKDGNRDNISNMELYVLYMFFTRRRFNVGNMILTRMLEVLDASSKSLPFNLLIMEILSKNGVVCHSSSMIPVRPVDTYSDSTLSRMGLTQDDGVWHFKKDLAARAFSSTAPSGTPMTEEEIRIENERHIPSEHRPPPPPSHSSARIEERLDMLTGLISSLASSVEKMEANLTASLEHLHRKVNSFHHRVDDWYEDEEEEEIGPEAEPPSAPVHTPPEPIFEPTVEAPSVSIPAPIVERSPTPDHMSVEPVSRSC